MSDPAIRAEGVSKSFGEDGVLSEISVTVDRGELVVLMGPNGIGKSVLLGCLAGGQRPDEGTVALFGHDPEQRRDRVSFLGQDAVVLDKLTGRENLRFYDRLHPQFTDAWRGLLEDLALSGDDLDKKVETYSGGMKRKLELAVSLSVDAPLYLLDEPTAALDLSTVNTVHSRLRERHEAGKTVVLASHLPMDAGIADRIVFLSERGIVATGTPTDLLEAVPPVVRTAAENADAVTDLVVDGELFETDGGVRGLLADGRNEAARERDGAELVEPTYADLFNYYAHLADPLGRTTAPEQTPHL